MDVQLYIYDLSNGLARQMSLALLGTQIDAVYHTSIVMEGLEYVYDGGIKIIKPGQNSWTPLQILDMGKTELPMDVILEYVESLKEVYTMEAYDIWSHNCNNFSNDLSTFLLGKGIPDHIANLPQAVLNTPFGRVLAPQVNQIVEQRRKTGLAGVGGGSIRESKKHSGPSLVKQATTNLELEKLLNEAKASCATVFFTSETCAPCKKLYPLYEELAAEARHKALIIIVDITRSYDIGSKYSIRSTPTFITFLNGEQTERWSGAGPARLKGNVQMLIQMAWPPHPHLALHLPALRSASTHPVLFSKLPPLGKLKAKMGICAEDGAVMGIMKFVSNRANGGPIEAPLPDLDAFSRFMRTAPQKLPPEIMFTIVDLMRIALIDPRFSGYYAEEKDHKTVAPLLTYVNGLKNCPYSLRLVALHMACNLFTSHLYLPHILKCPELTTPLVELITSSLLDDKHHNVRVAAASLAFNIAAANSRCRTEEFLDPLPEGDQVELAASLLEAISVEEESPEALKGFLLAFGYLVFCVPKDSELIDMLRSMDAQGTMLGKKKLFPKEPLIDDIGEVLLGKGLA